MTNLDRPQSVRAKAGEPVKPTSNFGIASSGGSDGRPTVAPHTSNVNPLSRILHFGERSLSGGLLIAIALGGSTLIHSGIALAAYMRDVTIFPVEPQCRAGESIQLQAYAHTAWNSRLLVTNSAQWKVNDNKLASHAGGGFFRCVAEGTTTITTSYLNRTTTFSLKIDPPIIMIEPPKEEPPPPPPPPEPDPEPVQAKAPAIEPKPAEAAPPPAAAKVGNLLTAPDDSKNDPDEGAVKFLSDENGKEFGSGYAAKGGTADQAGPGAKKDGKVGGTGGGGTGTGTGTAPANTAPPVDMSRAASLTVDNPCKGFFPSDADDDVARVSVLVTVKADGSVATVSVMDENPKGQGFGKAARTCMLSAKFNSAFGKDGKPVAATQQFNIRFTR